jgi:unsaturated rhamnogalacturonyl hydrolase
MGMESVKKAELRGLLQRAAPKLMELTYETWNFGDSTGFEAMLASAESLKSPELETFAYGWFRSWATKSKPFRRLDCTAPGLAIVLCAEKNGDSELLSAAVELAEYLVSRKKIDGVYETWSDPPLMEPYGGEPLPPDEADLLQNPRGGYFIDCLHFDPPFFAALARVTKDDRWRKEAIDQAMGYIAGLQQPSGLFYHFVLEGYAERPFGPGWGRGQGWALLGLLDVVEQLALPPEHEIAAAARALILAMIPLQRQDGSWPVVITDPDSGDEPSTAAFMAAGFLRAQRQSLVTDEEVARPASLALESVVKEVDSNGFLTGVSRAVMACTRPSHYAHVPRGFNVPWGQGPLILALCEALEP